MRWLTSARPRLSDQPATRRWAAGTVLLLAALGVSSCAPAAAPASRGSPPPVAAASPTPTPGAEPSPLARPSPSPRPSATPLRTFAGKVVNEPAARLRFGPGLDMPVVDLLPAGSVLTFDGWFRRPDEAPLPDATTGRIEPWSRDWLHLADGRGWVHSSAVLGQPPAGTPPLTWRRPPQLPAATASIVNVPLDLQDTHVTCEVAALKMALSARGISATEAQLLGRVGVDPRPPELDAAGRIVRWGNPNTGFVGDPAGRMSELTGYGVYSGPVAGAARASGVEVMVAGRDISPAAVYADLIAGHPVVAWVTSDYTRDQLRTWTAWDGSVVGYTLREHAVLLVGVTPTQLVIHDPWWGTLWRSRAVFESSYSTLGNMAVVIR
jgi:uncharacterized protein YvpB